MTKVSNTKRIWLSAAVGLLVVGLGCSTKSPTAPQQTPAPPPGGGASATWEITVTVTPDVIARESAEPARVSVRVRKVGDGSPPAIGTTIVVSTSLGEFGSLGSGLTSVVLSTSNGRAETLFFPGTIEGTAVITARLEASAGQTGVAIREGVVAAFTTANQVDNLSIQFVNLSTGEPKRFFWDFGDGGTSREENPSHLFAHPGDYAVSLRVERGVFTDRSIQTVLVREPLFITDVTPNEGPIGTSVQVRGQGFIRPLRVRFGEFTADVPFVSSQRNRLNAIVPDIPLEAFDVRPCTLADGSPGTEPDETFFDVTVETGDGTLSDSDTLINSFLVFPPPAECVGDSTGVALVASFAQACTGLTCTFTDTSTPSGSVASWLWSFGDGATSAVAGPVHTYGAAGTYTVTLTVTNSEGATATTSGSVTVP